MWPGDVNDVLHRKRARRIRGDFEESQLIEFCSPKKKGDFRLLADGLVVGAIRLGGAQVPLSPYVEKPLN